MKASEPDLLCADPCAEAVAAESSRIYERLATAVETEGFRSWLERVRALLNARSLSLVPAGDLPLVDDCVSVGAGSPELRTTIHGTFQKRVVATPTAELGPSGWTIIVPIQRDGALCAVLATQGNFQSRREVQAATVALQVAVGWILYRDRRLTADRLEQVLERSSDLLLLIQQAGKEEDPEVAVRVAVDGLRDYFRCEQLYLGWARGSRIRLAAISGVVRVDPRSVRTQPVEAAMRETLKLDRRLDYQPDSITTTATAGHALLVEDVGAARVTSLPLLEGRGVLLAQWNKPVSPELDRLIEASAPSAIGLFGLLRRAHPFPGVYPVARLWKRAKNHRRLIRHRRRRGGRTGCGIDIGKRKRAGVKYRQGKVIGQHQVVDIAGGQSSLQSISYGVSGPHIRFSIWPKERRKIGVTIDRVNRLREGRLRNRTCQMTVVALG